MKKLFVSLMVGALVASPIATYAQSKIERSTVTVNSRNSGLNVAIGRDSTANQGGVVLKNGAEITRSTIAVNSRNSGLNVAIGRNSDATQGGVTLK
ncbi:MAG: hypothetical protein ACT4QB_22885 [Gammaproteobacteria bacterium]